MHLREVYRFQGHYMNAFGTLQDMVEARDWLTARAQEAGVA
jgi:alpha/beta superfamily hydrolase